ncbi:RluA family pseudouridine synthase [uncultured Anaerococcus sp.]|uniref:RluA family pseudouridine synthase n=1 Tax=uncultured Anaerococcus sp. TaxID=293428 RepID=UPI00288B51C2|nr:RluA family pseudouridine synthase [uncultured Anaerococcus sp.]
MKYIKFKNSKKISLKKFLKEKSISMRAYQELIKGGIFVNDEPTFKNIALKEGDTIKIFIEDENLDYKPIEGDLKIVYEDDNLLVVNKPSGLTVNSNNQVSLANYLAYYYQENNIKAKIRLISRLDMNTSGLMMVAKNKYAQAYYQKQLEENKITKKYLAYIKGELNIDKLYKISLAYDESSKSYRENNDGKEAITYFKSIEVGGKYSVIECDIKTGKTHQIRASLSNLEFPIIGDLLYGSEYQFERFLLHSYYLEFKEFLSQESIILEDFPDFKPFLMEL